MLDKREHIDIVFQAKHHSGFISTPRCLFQAPRIQAFYIPKCDESLAFEYINRNFGFFLSMIVNLNLQGKSVVIVGGGDEAFKRIGSLTSEQCKITVISDAASPRIDKLAEDGKIRLERQRIQNVGFFARHNPDLVITTTDDPKLNQKIISHAKKKKIMAYSSDDPESSDYANLAVVDVENTVQIAVFTGGKSPSVAKKLRAHIRKNIKDMISSEDINQIKVQEIARKFAKEKIPSQRDRKAFLSDLMNDKRIKQLIKDGMLEKAEGRAIAMLRDWDEPKNNKRARDV